MRCTPPRSTARRKASLAPTDRLKCASSLGDLAFALTKSRMSGCDTSSTAMHAPRRRPPMETTLAAVSYSRRNDIGPLAVPPVLATRSPAGRTRLNAYPVPPPARWISAACPSVAKMECSESSTGSTKQPDSSPMSVPAFISVGELGGIRDYASMPRTARPNLQTRPAGTRPQPQRHSVPPGPSSRRSTRPADPARRGADTRSRRTVAAARLSFSSSRTPSNALAARNSARRCR